MNDIHTEYDKSKVNFNYVL